MLFYFLVVLLEWMALVITPIVNFLVLYEQ